MFVLKKSSLLKSLNVLIIISSFYLFDYLRVFLLQNFLPKSILRVNLIFSVSVIFLSFYYIVRHKYNISTFVWILIGVILCSMSYSYSSFYDATFNQYFMVINSIFIPLFLLGFKKNIILYKEDLIRKLIWMINFIVVICIILGVVDYITNYKVQIFLRDRVLQNEFYALNINSIINGSIYRFFNLFGHPLRFSGIILMFLSLNIIYNKHFKIIINNIYLYILSVIGLILVNSKSALLCGVALILINLVDEKKISKKVINLAIIILISFFVVNTSFFKETVINRFLNTDLTTGRLEIINEIANGTVDKPKFLGEGFGYGFYLSDIATSGKDFGAFNFEFPIILWSYDFGILSCITIYIVSFFMPILKMIKEKNLFIATSFFIVFLQVNTHAGLIQIDEQFFIQFCVYLYLISSISEYIKQYRGRQMINEKKSDNNYNYI